MSEALKVAVLDDELVARKRLTRLLQAIPTVELVGVFESSEQLLDHLSENEVDVLLLDIQMPGLSGVEAAGLLPKPGPAVIFTTAHPEHAVKAFELGAVDYVLKPIEADRLRAALERVGGRVQREELNRLPISTHQGIVLVDPNEISHAVFDGTLVTIRTRNGASLLTDVSLQELQDRLPSDRFERVHRRVLLNLEQVELLDPKASGGFVAHTRLGDSVPISRQAARRLRKRLGLGRAATV